MSIDVLPRTVHIYNVETKATCTTSLLILSKQQTNTLITPNSIGFAYVQLEAEFSQDPTPLIEMGTSHILESHNRIHQIYPSGSRSDTSTTRLHTVYLSKTLA